MKKSEDNGNNFKFFKINKINRISNMDKRNLKKDGFGVVVVV